MTCTYISICRLIYIYTYIYIYIYIYTYMDGIGCEPLAAAVMPASRFHRFLPCFVQVRGRRNGICTYLMLAICTSLFEGHRSLFIFRGGVCAFLECPHISSASSDCDRPDKNNLQHTARLTPRRTRICVINIAISGALTLRRYLPYFSSHEFVGWGGGGVPS